MPVDQLVSLASLVVKTGRYARGDNLLPSIQSQKAKVVLLSDGCGANRSKKIQDKCAYYQIPLIILSTLRFNAISSKVQGAMSVLDEGFAKSILNQAQLDSSLQLFNV